MDISKDKNTLLPNPNTFLCSVEHYLVPCHTGAQPSLVTMINDEKFYLLFVQTTAII